MSAVFESGVQVLVRDILAYAVRGDVAFGALDSVGGREISKIRGFFPAFGLGCVDECVLGPGAGIGAVRYVDWAICTVDILGIVTVIRLGLLLSISKQVEIGGA